LHHDQLQWLEMAVTSRGGLLLYLPPYSPMLNPIELAFNGVNNHIRANQHQLEVAMDGGRQLLADAFASIDGDLAKSYMQHMYTQLDLIV
jgi:transposase